MSRPDILTQEEVADILRISVRGVKTERLEGRLPYSLLAGKVRISRADLDEYRRRQRVIRLCLDQPKSPASTKGTARRTGKSSGTTDIATDELRQIQLISEKLASRSLTS